MDSKTIDVIYFLRKYEFKAIAKSPNDKIDMVRTIEPECEVRLTDDEQLLIQINNDYYKLPYDLELLKIIIKKRIEK